MPRPAGSGGANWALIGCGLMAAGLIGCVV